jgi:NAD+ synthase
MQDFLAFGHDIETVRKIEKLLYLAEYKRRQSAPGVKVTRKNFGRDRRYPIVNLFRDPGVSVTACDWGPGAARSTE